MRCQGQYAVVWVVLKLNELACAPENKVGSPEVRAVIRAQGGFPSPPCHPFYRVGPGGGAVTVTAQPHLRPATLKPEKTQGRRVNRFHMEVMRFSSTDEQASSLWRWLVNALDDAKPCHRIGVAVHWADSTCD